NFLVVFLLFGLNYLRSDVSRFAISLGLSLIATDNADNFLCVRPQRGDVLLLRLRIERRCRNKQARNDQQPFQMARSHQQTFLGRVSFFGRRERFNQLPHRSSMTWMLSRLQSGPVGIGDGVVTPRASFAW